MSGAVSIHVDGEETTGRTAALDGLGHAATLARLTGRLEHVLATAPAEATMCEWEWEDSVRFNSARAATVPPSPDQAAPWCLAAVLSYWAFESTIRSLGAGADAMVGLPSQVPAAVYAEALILLAPYLPLLQLPCDALGIHQLRIRVARGNFEPDARLQNNLLVGQKYI